MQQKKVAPASAGFGHLDAAVRKTHTRVPCRPRTRMSAGDGHSPNRLCASASWRWQRLAVAYHRHSRCQGVQGAPALVVAAPPAALTVAPAADGGANTAVPLAVGGGAAVTAAAGAAATDAAADVDGDIPLPLRAADAAQLLADAALGALAALRNTVAGQRNRRKCSVDSAAGQRRRCDSRGADAAELEP